MKFQKQIKSCIFIIPFFLFVTFFSFGGTEAFNSKSLIIAQAQSGGSTTQVPVEEEPYGGEKFVTIPCTCDSGQNSYILIDDYLSGKTISLLYKNGQSELFEYFNLFGTYFLGTYDKQGGVCKVGSAPNCTAIHYDGILGNEPGTGTSQ